MVQATQSRSGFQPLWFKTAKRQDASPSRSGFQPLCVERAKRQNAASTLAAASSRFGLKRQSGRMPLLL
jgi:hypothetical protein